MKSYLFDTHATFSYFFQRLTLSFKIIKQLSEDHINKKNTGDFGPCLISLNNLNIISIKEDTDKVLMKSMHIIKNVLIFECKAQCDMRVSLLSNILIAYIIQSHMR